MAAVQAIDEEGINGATIRKIAGIANVNSAAISYYFGNRDELMSMALGQTLDNAFDFTDFKYSEEDNYRAILKAIFTDWKNGAIAYPGITYAHFDDIINNRTHHEVTKKRINDFIEEVYSILIKRGLKENEENYKKLKLIFGSFVSTLLKPDVAYPQNNNDEIDILVSML
jgi:AcrR family transcriptional regulator